MNWRTICFSICMVLFAHCQDKKIPAPISIEAKAGILSLENWDHATRSSISLAGEWEFYPGEFLKSGEFPASAPQFHEVPRIWNGKIDPNSETGLGYGTLRLKVHSLPESELFLYISSIPTAHRFYCGNDLVLESGQIGKNKEESIPNLGFATGVLPANCFQSGEFIWQISNFFEFKGGPWTVPKLGTKHSILLEQSNAILQDLFFLGVTAIMGVYHFVLWIFRKKDKRSLMFSLICFLFMIRILGTGKLPEFYFPEANLYEWMNKFEYLGYVGLIVTFPWLWKILFPFDINTLLLQANSFFGACFLTIILFFPSIVYTSLLSYIQFQTLAIILIVSYGLCLAIWRNRTGAKIMGVGYLFVITSILHDLFISHRLIYGIHIAPIGFFAFLVAQSAILAKIFSNAFQTAEHLTKNLQSEVEEKTRALKREDERKTAFFANISHELRTPLTLILGPIEAALSKKNTLTESKLHILYNNAKRLASLVNQLLDLQKIAAGKFQLKPKAFSLEKMVQEILLDFSYLLEKKQISFTFQTETDSPFVFADPIQVEKCIQNYLSNALKFTPLEGQIHLKIQEEDDFQIRFEIMDSGVGIDEANQTHLFQRFGHSEVSLIKEQDGTGLGLSIVREIIELHKGQVGFASQKNKGSKFWFTLPKAEKNSVLAPISTNKDLIPVLLSPRKKEGVEFIPKKEEQDIRLLVVEDNPDLGDYLQELLEEVGYQVYRAYDGEEGLTKIREIQPDLILTDLMMPKKSGSDLIQTYKANPTLKTIPSILLTAKAEEDTRREVRIVGADAYLAKPFVTAELLAVVKNLLRIKEKEKYLLKEYQRAKKIQESLLPKITNTYPQFDIECYLHSQDTIGGDFYDFLDLQNGRLRYMIADVSGHGLSAALIAGTLKLVFQKSTFLTVEDFLESTNSDLGGNLAGNFITTQLIDIDLEKSEMEVCNAGHPPLLLLRKGNILRYQTKGKALGLTSGNLYPKLTVPLEPGDRIVMYTDGFTEIFGEDRILFGEERWEATLLASAHYSLSEAKEYILSQIFQFAYPLGFSDDATFLLIEWKG